MTIGLLFWILWVFWAIFGFYAGWNVPDATNRRNALGGNILLLVLFFLVGWKVFGFVIKE